MILRVPAGGTGGTGGTGADLRVYPAASVTGTGDRDVLSTAGSIQRYERLWLLLGLAIPAPRLCTRMGGKM